MKTNKLMNLNQRIAEAKKIAKAEAKQYCKDRGHHNWDFPGGMFITGGGHKIDGGFGCEEQQYSEQWCQYRRKCMDCGEIEISEKDGAEWKYDAGLGHFECDPRTGELFWIDKNGKKEKYISEC